MSAARFFPLYGAWLAASLGLMVVAGRWARPKPTKTNPERTSHG